MSNYRRVRSSGGTYFFTVVTFLRRPLFADEFARLCLREAISEVRIGSPFTIDGFCLLPDHIHTIWTLPESDTNYSQCWAAIKGHFSRKYRRSTEKYTRAVGSRSERGEVTIWQRRFWEHLIRDEDDFKQHLDYIHYNPVKHGHVKSVMGWPWSSFHRYVRHGVYALDWGGSNQAKGGLGATGE